MCWGLSLAEVVNQSLARQFLVGETELAGVVGAVVIDRLSVLALIRVIRWLRWQARIADMAGLVTWRDLLTLEGL